MHHIAVLATNAILSVGVGLGVFFWVSRFHSPDDGAPIGAGLVYVVLIVLITAATTFLLQVGAESVGQGLVRSVLNIVITGVVQFVYFALKDGLSQAGELGSTATVFVLLAAVVGTAGGLAARS